MLAAYSHSWHEANCTRSTPDAGSLKEFETGAPLAQRSIEQAAAAFRLRKTIVDIKILKT